MGKKIWELLKTLLIVALVCSLLLLAVAALPAETIRSHQWLSHLLQPMSPLLGLSQAELTYVQTALPGTNASQPTAISMKNDAGRSTVLWDFSALDQTFEAYGGLLGQALDTAGDFLPVEQDHIRQVLSGPSICFQYDTPQPVAVLASWLDADVKAEIPDSRLCILAPEDGVVRLHLVGDSCLEADTEVSARELLSLLDQAKPDGSQFAFEAGLDLDPFSLLPSTPPVLTSALISNPCNGLYMDNLATDYGFNPYSDSRYVDSDGTVHFSESNRTLQISASGRVQLTSSAPDRFTAPGASVESLVEHARHLLQLAAVPGTGRLYLTGVTGREDQTVCTFDYFCNGIPVALSAAPAATVTFSGTRVTDLTIQVVRFTRAEAQLQPLPMAQAIALLPQGAPLALQYCMGPDQMLTIGWQKP